MHVVVQFFVKNILNVNITVLETKLVILLRINAIKNFFSITLFRLFFAMSFKRGNLSGVIRTLIDSRLIQHTPFEFSNRDKLKSLKVVVLDPENVPLVHRCGSREGR